MEGYDYTKYLEFTKTASENSLVFETFKQNTFYKEILEHVTFTQGAQYLALIWHFFKLSDQELEEFCALNDRYGSPQLFEYSSTLKCSPTSLRYIFHSLLILHYIRDLQLKEVSIVEVGCGYGGLFLAIQHFAKKVGITLKQYRLIDLPEVVSLQKTYLSKHTSQTPTAFYDATRYGSEIQETDLFFISNYCFSEISDANRRGYIEHLLPKCSHGFIAWNMIDLFDFGKKYIEGPELPRTGDKNKFIYF
jgi:hypothetical protein